MGEIRLFKYLALELFAFFLLQTLDHRYLVESYANSNDVSVDGSGDYPGCPNGCNGHGSCGVFGSCKCFRYWGAPDCSQRLCPFGFAIINSGGRDINVDGDAEDATNIAINSGSKSTVPGTMVCKERSFTALDNAECKLHSGETCMQKCTFLDQFPTKTNLHGKYGRDRSADYKLDHGYEKVAVDSTAHHVRMSMWSC